MTVKSVTLQPDSESNSVPTNLYGEVCVSAAARILSVSQLSSNSVNSAVLDNEVSYSKFSL